MVDSIVVVALSIVRYVMMLRSMTTINISISIYMCYQCVFSVMMTIMMMMVDNDDGDDGDDNN